MGSLRWGIAALAAGWIMLVGAPAAVAASVTYTHSLDVFADEGGHVVSDPAGIDCPGQCGFDEVYDEECPPEGCPDESDIDWGTYTLTASGKGAGWRPFWQGCSVFNDDGTCTVTLSTAEREVDLGWDDIGLPTVDAITAPAKVAGTLKVSATASDNDRVKAVRFAIGTSLVVEDDTAPYEATFDTSKLRNGRTSTVTATAIDPADNRSVAAAASFKVDLHTYVKVSLEPNTNRRPLFFHITPDPDVVSMTCAVDGGTPVPCDRHWKPDLGADGTHSVTVTATDDVGNTASDTATTLVDSTGPVVNFLGPTENGTGYAPDVPFSFTLAEANLRNVDCAVDGAAMPCVPDQTFWLHGLADGGHSISISARDAAGNVVNLYRYFSVGVPKPVRGSSVARPRLRIRALVLRRATRLSRLAIVNVPARSRLEVRCIGASCPVERAIYAGIAGTVSVEDLLYESLRPGVWLRLTLIRKGATPVQWTIRFRRGARPVVS